MEELSRAVRELAGKVAIIRSELDVQNALRAESEEHNRNRLNRIDRLRLAIYGSLITFGAWCLEHGLQWFAGIVSKMKGP